MKMIQFISWFDLASVAILIAITGLISLGLRLGLASKLAVASIRTVVQLTLLGFVLQWIFHLNRWYLVIGLLLIMLVLASTHALRRASWTYKGSQGLSLLSLAVSTFITALIVTQLIIKVHPWYNPQYLIPIVGMILGNSLTGISLGIDQFLGTLKQQRLEIQDRLAMGATSWEAAFPAIKQGIYHGHIPILNAMTVAGIISLPGMMTGQILAGISPMLAVRYQIVVMFMITAACSLGTVIFILITTRRLFTSWHQLNEELIIKRK